MSTNWMAPKEYFERIVRPTVEDYQADRTAHRKASAVFQLSSIAERYFKYHKDQRDKARVYNAKGPEEFVKELSKRGCPECLVLWKAANAVKHHIPDEKTSPSAMAYTATGVAFDPAEYASGGRQFTVDEVIDTVYEYWRKRLDTEHS